MEDLKPLRIFLQVADQRSFAGAARTLGLTPTTVTRSVARLEETLGQQLLLRTTRAVSLTSAGALVAARYRPILQDLDTTTDTLRRESLPDRGRLRINAPMSMGLRLLPDLIDRFRLAYPYVDLTVQMTDRLIDVMEAGCDLAIRISGPPTDTSTIWRKICTVPRQAIAAPVFFERNPRPKTPDELDPQLCLSYGEGPETWSFQQGALKRQVRAGSQLVTNNGDLLVELATKGLGIGVLPEFICEPALKSGDLIRVFPDWTVSALWLTLYYPPYDQLPPLVATFTDFFEAHLKDTSPQAFAWQT